MPFGYDCNYKHFKECVEDYMKKGKSEEAARKICGSIMRDTESK